MFKKLFKKITKSRQSSTKLFIGGFLPVLAVGTAFFFWGEWGAGRSFSRVTEELFRSEMMENTLNMHYTVAYPEDFGLKDYEAVLSGYSAEGRQEALDYTEEVLVRLNDLRSDRLKDQDAYTHQLLTRSLNTSLRLNDFLYYEEPLTPASGMQTQLPILLAEYTFRSRRDVEDYLSLLDQTDEYFASLLAYEQEKAEAGLLMAASSMEKVRKQCDTIVTLNSLEKGNHFLQTTFAERLAELAEARATATKGSRRAADKLTSEDIAAYIVQNDRLLKTVLLPAYQALSDGLFLLEDGTIPLTGLAAKPQGKEYYQYLLIAETGSYRSVAEIKELLTAKLQEEYDAMRNLLIDTPQLKEHFLTKQHLSLPFQDHEGMLTDLQERMAAEFPSLTADNAQAPRVLIKSVDPSLEEYCAPAFYLTAPIDDTDTNVIYINQKNSPKGLELYTTLAHEGYPGHLYQTVYNNRSFAAAKEDPVRQLLWYGGYLEGWALYVEFEAYDYAAKVLAEAEPDPNALSVQLEKHNRSMQLCLFSIIDIMIHYENASYSQVAKVLENFGVKNPDSAGAVYTYIAESPCNYMKYYLGYLEILELQKTAKTAWGDAYSDYAFHKFFLDCGPSDFTSLLERLNAFSSIPPAYFPDILCPTAVFSASLMPPQQAP